MRELSHRPWQTWRVKLADAPACTPAGRPAGPRFLLATSPVAAADRDEVPGPDGIRHELVARVRAAIAAGAYDGEEMWAAAEERLFRAVEGAV